MTAHLTIHIQQNYHRQDHGSKFTASSILLKASLEPLIVKEFSSEMTLSSLLQNVYISEAIPLPKVVKLASLCIKWLHFGSSLLFKFLRLSPM